jgi:hypothetical protein
MVTRPAVFRKELAFSPPPLRSVRENAQVLVHGVARRLAEISSLPGLAGQLQHIVRRRVEVPPDLSLSRILPIPELPCRLTESPGLSEGKQGSGLQRLPVGIGQGAEVGCRRD